MHGRTNKDNTMTHMYIAVEKYTVKEDDSILIEGIALPKNVKSRNNNYYDWESVLSSYKTLEGKPVLFNHDENKVIGHVKEVWVEDDGLHYKADLDPGESDLVRKVRRGDISNVSIQAIVNEPTEWKEDVPVFPIKEFLELSLVTIPGFADTTAEVVEKLKKEYDKRYQEPDGTFKKMTCPDNPDEESKFCGCVRYMMTEKGLSLDSAKKLCAYIASHKKSLSDCEIRTLTEILKEDDEMIKEQEQPAQEPQEPETPDVWQEITDKLDEIVQRLDALEARVAKLEEPEEAPETPASEPAEEVLRADDIKTLIKLG